ARVTAGARERASKLRRLPPPEEGGEPQMAPPEALTNPDTGQALGVATPPEGHQQTAWAQGQTAALHEHATAVAAAIQDERPGGRPPWLWPVSGQVSAEFGGRSSPYGRSWEFHPGLDIRATTGTPVTATGSGLVVFAGRMSGYGNMVVVDHGFELKTVYAHLS